MKIRCTDCEKKISIDDAFAGGICRCPYCKALVAVPGEMDTRSQRQRPDAPGGRPIAPASSARPETPPPAGTPRAATTAAAAVTQPISEDQIPMAQPVLLQGALVVLLLVAMLGVVGGVAAVIIYEMVHEDNAVVIVETPVSENPFVTNTRAAAVAGNIEIKTPVAYVLDGGTSLREFFPQAARMVIASVESLDGKGFTVIVAGEKSDAVLPDALAAATPARIEAARAMLDQGPPGGATPLNRSVQAALDSGAATIVLILRKEADTAMPLAETFKEKQVQLVVLGLAPSPAESQSQSAFAEAAGGTSVAWSRSDIGTLQHQADDLPPAP